MGWLDNQEGAKRSLEDQRDAFEERVIKRLLAAANVPYSLKRLREDASSMNGGRFTLTFDWFSQVYPRFPLRMGAAKVAWTHEIKCGDLFGSHFTKLPFFVEYQKFMEQSGLDDRNERVALLFNWTGIDAGGTAMVLHNYPLNLHKTPDPEQRLERGTKIVRPFGNPVVVYVIESLADLMVSVGNDWAE